MSRLRQSGSKESEYRRTAGGVDLEFFDAPTTSSRNIAPSIVPPITDPQSWTRYYERREPGTSTDVIDTDKAQQTTLLILQEASVMAARGDDETPLIYSTQTAATVADLEMEDENKEPNTCRLTGEGTGLTVSISGSGVVTPVPSVTKTDKCFTRTSDPSGSF